MAQHVCGFISQHVWEGSFFSSPGSVPSTLPLKTYFQEFLPGFIMKHGITDFAVSMELGPSLDFAESVLSLQNSHSLRLICIIPFEEQHSAWPEIQRNRYFSILEHCNSECIIANHFSLDCYRRSFQHLTKICHRMLSLHSDTPSDALAASIYARKLGRFVHVLDANFSYAVVKMKGDPNLNKARISFCIIMAFPSAWPSEWLFPILEILPAGSFAE